MEMSQQRPMFCGTQSPSPVQASAQPLNNHLSSVRHVSGQTFLSFQQSFIQLTIPLLQLAANPHQDNWSNIHNLDIFSELQKAFDYAIHGEISRYYNVLVISESHERPFILHPKFPICLMLLVLVLTEKMKGSSQKLLNPFLKDITEVFTNCLFVIALAVPSLKPLIISTITTLLRSQHDVMRNIQYRITSQASSVLLYHSNPPLKLGLPPDPDTFRDEIQFVPHTEPPFSTQSILLKELYDIVKGALQQEFGSSIRTRWKIYGSSVNGFELITSDIDSMIDTIGLEDRYDEPDIPRFLQRISHAIENYIPPSSQSIRPSDCQLIMVMTARIPILRIIYDPSQGTKGKGRLNRHGVGPTQEISISLNNYFPVLNSKLLYCYSMLLDPFSIRSGSDGEQLNPLVQFVTMIKQWAKSRRKLGDSTNGGLSSYSWTIMAIAYLIETRWLPCLGGSWQQESTVRRAFQSPSNPERLYHGESRQQLFYDWISLGKTAEDVMGIARIQAWNDLYSNDSFDQGLKQMVSGFFEYYGYAFDFYHDAIDIRDREGRTIKTKAQVNPSLAASSRLKNSDRYKKMHWLWIIDPFELNRIIMPNENIMEEIIKEFRRGYIICSTVSSPCRYDWKMKLLSKTDNVEERRLLFCDSMIDSNKNDSIESLKQQLFRSLCW